ncbi:SUKH-4 family immunity protein [Streptomyces sp. NPDC051104]|uniref:SUKH-4 family immunity protein n=1 Tax=Streptomyces sp. NPDC051104 TaxID=3155044 RepID=UPI00341B6F42
MTQGSGMTIGDVVAAVESARIHNVPAELVGLLRESNLPSTIEGMFYTSPAVMFLPLEVNGVEYFTLGFNEKDVAGRYVTSQADGVFFLGCEMEFRFVNSRLNDFLRFLEGWHQFISAPASRDIAGELDDDALIEAGMNLKEALEEIDEAAFSDEETWWSHVFEEVELGTLGPL